jgi:hypothetical protein
MDLVVVLRGITLPHGFMISIFLRMRIGFCLGISILLDHKKTVIEVGEISMICFLFNEVIGHLGLQELPLKGRKFTWSNMQKIPLLEQLDWFFTTSNWILDYPNSLVLPLARKGSDHTPCIVNIDTDIPKAKIFCFENFWVDLPRFMECVKKSWSNPSHKKL